MSKKAKPYSLKKFLADPKTQIKPITILVDGTGLGIAKDDPNVFVVTSEECIIQCDFFRQYCIDHNAIFLPKYLKENLMLFYPKQADDDQFFMELLLNTPNNPEARQIIGMTMLVQGALSMAKSQHKGLRIYLEHPEVHMHPNKQSIIADWIIKMYNKYK